MNSQVQEIIQFVNEGKERQELLRVFVFTKHPKHQPVFITTFTF